MITLQQYLGGYDKTHPQECTLEIMRNAQHMCDMANWLLKDFGFLRGVNSGWRPKDINEKTLHAAPHSKHIIARAIDLSDRDRALAVFCVVHQDILQHLGLWMEDPRWTPTWVHVQDQPPGSGHRIFIPDKYTPPQSEIDFWKYYLDQNMLLKL